MTKEQFFTELEEHLKDISYEERQSALRYYEEYFEDAGADETAVAGLDSPEEIAKAIKNDLDIRLQLVHDSGKQDNTTNQESATNQGTTPNQEIAPNQGSYDTQNQETKEHKNMPVWQIVLLVIAAILISPVALGGGGAIVGIIVGICSVVIGIGLSAIAMVVAGIIVIVTGISTMFASPIVGLIILGTGILILGIGLLFGYLTVLFWGTGVPAFVRWIKKLIKGNKKEAA